LPKTLARALPVGTAMLALALLLGVGAARGAEKSSPGKITDDELIACSNNYNQCADACAKMHDQPSGGWCQNDSACTSCVNDVCGAAYYLCKQGALATLQTDGKSRRPPVNVRPGGVQAGGAGHSPGVLAAPK